TARLTRQRMDRWADKHGLSEGRLHALFQLAAAANHRLPLGELADHLDVSPRNVTGPIVHLEEDGLVQRNDATDDRRLTNGHLTEGLARWRTVGVVAGTMLALLLAALDQTIVGTAMPRIVSELNGLNYYSWVITAYLVASTIMVPIAGKLGDLFGRKPFLLAGMIGFVAASALCGQSHGMLELVTFRTIQGIFGGMLFATVSAVFGDLFPPARRARLQGLFGGVFGLSSILG